MKYFKTSLFILISVISIFGVAIAGTLTPSSAPAATLITLNDLYQKVLNNSYVISVHSFNPTLGPASTNNSLQNIWNIIPMINSGNIISGYNVLGVSGTYNISSLTPDKVATGTVYGLGQVGTRVTLSSAKNITAFSFSSPSVSGTINQSSHTISLTVPFGTNVTSLTPNISVSANATVSSSTGVAKNFTNPVTYIVTAQDLSTQNYLITVTIAPDPFPTWSYGINGLRWSPDQGSMTWNNAISYCSGLGSGSRLPGQYELEDALANQFINASSSPGGFVAYNTEWSIDEWYGNGVCSYGRSLPTPNVYTATRPKTDLYPVRCVH